MKEPLVTITQAEYVDNPMNDYIEGLGKLFIGADSWAHIGNGRIRAFRKYIEKVDRQKYKGYVRLEVYGYDHSGLAVSTEPFICPWDSGLIGYIVVTHKDACKFFGWKAVSRGRVKTIKMGLHRQIEELNQYLSGDIWDVHVSLGGLQESCHGCYGHEYAQEVAEELSQELRSQIFAQHGEQLAFAFRE